MYKFGKTSLNRLVGVNPEIIHDVMAMLKVSEVDVTIVEGVRSVEQQRIYVAKGVSWTMNSYHLSGNAVDMAPYRNGRIDWGWIEGYCMILEAMNDVGSSVKGMGWVWGKDYPHWQLEGSRYDIRSI